MLEKKMQHMMQCNFIARRCCFLVDINHKGRWTDIMAKLCGVANIIFTQTFLLGWKKIFEVQFEPAFCWLVCLNNKKKTRRKFVALFWFKPTEAGWLASIFGLQVEDTLHKDFGLGRWTSLFRPTKIPCRLRWLDSCQRVTILEPRAVFFTSHKVGPNEV